MHSSEAFVNRKHLTKYGSTVEQPPDDDAVVYAADCEDFGFFEWGRDVGGAHRNYKYTKKEKETLASYESVDYMPPHSEVFKMWIRCQSRRVDFDRWLMMGLIGLSVGAVGFLLHSIIDVLSDARMNRVRQYLQQSSPDFVLAWAWATGISVLFLLVSSLLVVYVAPAAGSSGIPELMAFLNGTLVRHIFNVRTLIVKFCSCVLAVASGLAVGQEGPMIHLGSMIGAGLSQFKSDTLKFKLPFFQRFRNSQDRRNFISAGAAAGIASAFNAPVGGLLFSMEEVSSFWNETLSWQIFFCCMVAVITTDLLNTALADFQLGSFGQFKSKRYILFQVRHGFDFNLAIFIPVIILGVIGGVLGSLFIFMNLKVNRGRKKLISGIRSPRLQKFVRLIEPLVVGILYITASILIPYPFKCKSVSCSQPASNSSSGQCLVPLNNDDSVFRVDDSFENYTCPPGVLFNTGLVNRNNRTYDTVYTNATYNPVATLTFGTGEEAIRHLFSRQTYGEFEYDELLTVLGIYFVGACYSSGMSLATGIVVPQLMIGALYGRIVGRIMVRLFEPLLGTDSYLWIDPGAMSLIGAASFFGGVTRLTMSLVVIMMELTNDIQFLLPVMVTVMVAKWVGDILTKPMYHSQMNLKCIPHLNSEPVVHDSAGKRVSLELFTAEEVMSTPVETVQETEKLQRIVHLLLHTEHCGFPVIRRTDEGIDVFEGLITRLELTVLLMKQAFLPESIANNLISHVSEVSYDQLNVDRLSNPQHVESQLQTYASDEAFRGIQIWLRPYMNQSAMSVRRNFSLERTLILVRSMGIRHVTVVDSLNRVIGIITRKDLMGDSMDSRLRRTASESYSSGSQSMHRLLTPI